MSDTDRTALDAIRIGTYNIRIATTEDQGVKAWCYRSQGVKQILDVDRFDVIGFQEILDQSQENDLRSWLPNHAFFVRSLEINPWQQGERLAIAWDKNRFDCLDRGYFYLSETPDIPSYAWDARTMHLCLWCRFIDTRYGKDFYVFNTHLDYSGAESRMRGTALILQRIDSITEGLPTILLGDFNASPYERTVYDSLSHRMKDAYTVSATPPVGYVSTYNAWMTPPERLKAIQRRIDYVFVRQMDVLSYESVNTPLTPTAWPSDHFPLLVKMGW
jgi:endonuclease/exonuclease/phosphatase family metal-dependent hydrolase